MNLDENQAIKVLWVNPEDGSLRSCHGGDFQWDPPILKDDGSYIPGEWTPSVDPFVCTKGYHLTDDPFRWWYRKNRFAYLVEFYGKVDGSFKESPDRKIAVESCRLLRPLTATELAGYNIFIEGEHRIRGNTRARADGNAVVYASDSTTVYATGNSRVFACDNTLVTATDNAKVGVTDSSIVYAYDNVAVRVDGGAHVEAMKGFKGTIARKIPDLTSYI